MSKDITELEDDAIQIMDFAEERGLSMSEVSDGYHTFSELYEFRKAFNAALFNEWHKQGIHDTHKSWKHADGKDCFSENSGWFIVVAVLPTGQISNHYPAKDWNDFKIEEVEKAKYEFDGHTPADVLERIKALYV